MHVRRPLAVSGLLLSASVGVLGLAGPASAQTAVCDAYSTNCPSPAPSGGGVVDTDVSGTTEDAGTTDDAGAADARPSSLPITGGELVLLSAVGVGALVGGTALVVAGRRKAATTAA